MIIAGWQIIRVEVVYWQQNNLILKVHDFTTKQIITKDILWN